MEILGIVPARGGSRGVPGKNIKPLAGKPLIAYSLEEALACRQLNRVVVTTDDQEIARVARQYGGEVPFLRPAELAGDQVTDFPVFEHCLAWLRDNQGYRPDLIVHLRPTAPLRRSRHISEIIEVMMAHPEADSVRSVTQAGQHPLKMWRIAEGRLSPFIPEEYSGIPESYNQPRQKLPQAYIQNGVVDVIRWRTIMEAGSMSGKLILPYVMDELDSVNIDSPLDFLLAETIMANRHVSVPD
jgi:CMP-N-acetylneuraminic acid synthetase